MQNACEFEHVLLVPSRPQIGSWTHHCHFSQNLLLCCLLLSQWRVRFVAMMPAMLALASVLASVCVILSQRLSSEKMSFDGDHGQLLFLSFESRTL